MKRTPAVDLPVTVHVKQQMAGTNGQSNFMPLTIS